jgi:hypothetical protein
MFFLIFFHIISNIIVHNVVEHSEIKKIYTKLKYFSLGS